MYGIGAEAGTASTALPTGCSSPSLQPSPPLPCPNGCGSTQAREPRRGAGGVEHPDEGAGAEEHDGEAGDLGLGEAEGHLLGGVALPQELDGEAVEGVEAQVAHQHLAGDDLPMVDPDEQQADPEVEDGG